MDKKRGTQVLLLIGPVIGWFTPEMGAPLAIFLFAIAFMIIVGMVVHLSARKMLEMRIE